MQPRACDPELDARGAKALVIGLAVGATTGSKRSFSLSSLVHAGVATSSKNPTAIAPLSADPAAAARASSLASDD
jgi:hypothetical protein